MLLYVQSCDVDKHMIKSKNGSKYALYAVRVVIEEIKNIISKQFEIVHAISTLFTRQDLPTKHVSDFFLTASHIEAMFWVFLGGGAYLPQISLKQKRK
jgi:thiaminase